MGRLFGTDGVRGVANAAPLTPELTCRLGRAAATYLAERVGSTRRRPTILIGRDTRVSGPLVEQALVAGVLSAGVDALVAGVLPTPAVAFLTAALGAAGGAVLSASHNPFEDNGVKLFSGEGDKLPDAWEDEIEARIQSEWDGPRPTGAGIGRVRTVPGGRAPVSRRAPSQSAAGPGPGGLPSRARLCSRRNVPRRSSPLSRSRGRGRDAGDAAERDEHQPRDGGAPPRGTPGARPCDARSDRSGV